MKTNYLLPNQFKKIGWVLFIPGLLLGAFFLISEPDIDFLNVKVFSITGNSTFSFGGQSDLPKKDYFSLIENNILDEIIGLLLIIGALFVAFSKEKYEDEFIAKIRLESLVWATYINYAILIIAIISIFELMFFWVLVFNMFTILIIFIIRFHWVLYKSKNQISDEE